MIRPLSANVTFSPSSQNHAEHTARWAPGTFLASVRHQVGGWPRAWEVWLALNPKNDATAVWVERKLGVSEAATSTSSGRWVNEAVYAIGEKAGTERKDTQMEAGVEDRHGRELDPESELACPGLMCFECTPLEGQDELER
jgi:hypothetical protein